MSKLIFFIALFGVGYLLYHLYGKNLIKKGPKGFVKPALIALFVLVLLAVATGRANAIFAVFGGLFAAAWRMAPLLFRFYPQIRQLLNKFGVQSPGYTGASKVNTASLAMSLDHRTGRIDGDIIAGQFKGRKLSELTFEEIRQFYQICQKQDVEALRLLEAFIQREYPDKWSEQAWSQGESSQTTDQSGMTLDEAWDTLGLNPGSSRDDITHAHRKLMSKIHPDKGGNTFLAARVNQAKDRLLAELSK